ncbi:MAG: S1C family serine protease [Candidatus Onthomonas sp.]
MGYNMYDKNYGSGFTPENDNRPPEQRPGSQAPVSGEYHYSYGFQPADAESAYHANPTPPPQPPKKKNRSSGSHKGLKIVALVLACLLVGGGAGAGGAYLMFSALNGDGASIADASEAEKDTESSSKPNLQVSDRSENTAAAAPVSSGETMTPSQIYDAYSNSVVSIEVQTANGIGAGTGFVISDDGYILTCYHVVKGYQALSCTFIDSTSYEATYVGGDEDADLAVLKIEANDGSSFTPVIIGDSDKLSVGGTVTAIGNALGTFANTLTSGTVSGLDRALTMSDGTVMNVLQTDCTVNSGNSGGPLFNEYGEVIGVVNAKYSSSGYSSGNASIEGIGFAIPINDAMDILDDLIEHGYITGKPYLGITVSTVSSITAQQYSNMVVGAYVRSVQEGSCSEKAGLQVGDIITQVEGQDITTYEELIDAKNALRAGDDMTLTVFREGSYYTIVVTLDELVPESAADNSSEQSGSGSNGSDGGQYYTNPYDFFNDFFGGRNW